LPALGPAGGSPSTDDARQHDVREVVVSRGLHDVCGPPLSTAASSDRCPRGGSEDRGLTTIRRPLDVTPQVGDDRRGVGPAQLARFRRLLARDRAIADGGRGNLPVGGHRNTVSSCAASSVQCLDRPGGLEAALEDCAGSDGILEVFDLTGTLRGAAELAAFDHKTVAHWVQDRGGAGGGLPVSVRACSRVGHASSAGVNPDA